MPLLCWVSTYKLVSVFTWACGLSLYGQTRADAAEERYRKVKEDAGCDTSSRVESPETGKSSLQEKSLQEIAKLEGELEMALSSLEMVKLQLQEVQQHKEEVMAEKVGNGNWCKLQTGNNSPRCWPFEILNSG